MVESSRAEIARWVPRRKGDVPIYGDISHAPKKGRGATEEKPDPKGLSG